MHKSLEMTDIEERATSFNKIEAAVLYSILYRYLDYCELHKVYI